jgi:hypothetical protein
MLFPSQVDAKRRRMGYGPSLAVVVDTREYPKCSGTGITRLIKKLVFLNEWRGSDDNKSRENLGSHLAKKSASPPTKKQFNSWLTRSNLDRERTKLERSIINWVVRRAAYRAAP